MAIGGPASYYIRGTKPFASGNTLEEALLSLLQYWESRRPLAVHEMGNLLVYLQVGTVTVSFEVTDPRLLQDLRGPAGPRQLIDALAAKMNLPLEEARRLLAEARADVEVTTLRVPVDIGAWSPDPWLDPHRVLREATPKLLGAWMAEVDDSARRGVRRPRTAEGERLLRAAVDLASTQHLSIAEVARRTGIPATTLRDARARMRREEEGVAASSAHVPKRRWSADDKVRIKEALVTWKGNAAEVSRRLHVPERTVRDVRARAVETRSTERRQYTTADKALFLSRLRQGETPTEVGRALGIPGRTARGWAKKPPVK
mgnify:CR=1 FL=1